MKYKLQRMYMSIAIDISNMSYSKRNQVGAVLVKDQNIISFGWNGMPSGFNNCCEDHEGKTRSEVIHAEMNVFAKLAKTGVSSKDATLFITLSPCYDCSKLIIQSGVKEVIYLQEYRDRKPLQFLKKAGVKVTKFE